MNTTKNCIVCKILKNIDEFYVDKKQIDGHKNKCKLCAKSQRHDNYHKPKGKFDAKKDLIFYMQQFITNNSIYDDDETLDELQKILQKLNDVHKQIYDSITTNKIIIEYDKCDDLNTISKVQSKVFDYTKKIINFEDIKYEKKAKNIEITIPFLLKIDISKKISIYLTK